MRYHPGKRHHIKAEGFISPARRLYNPEDAALAAESEV